MPIRLPDRIPVKEIERYEKHYFYPRTVIVADEPVS